MLVPRPAKSPYNVKSPSPSFDEKGRMHRGTTLFQPRPQTSCRRSPLMPCNGGRSGTSYLLSRHRQDRRPARPLLCPSRSSFRNPAQKLPSADASMDGLSAGEPSSLHVPFGVLLFLAACSYLQICKDYTIGIGFCKGAISLSFRILY